MCAGVHVHAHMCGGVEDRGQLWGPSLGATSFVFKQGLLTWPGAPLASMAGWTVSPRDLHPPRDLPPRLRGRERAPARLAFPSVLGNELGSLCLQGKHSTLLF